MKDMDMLNAVLACDRLRDDEREAFDNMRERLQVQAYGYDTLSQRQRAWLEQVYERLELDAEAGAQNLVSSGRVHVDPRERMRVFGYEQMPRPAKPPGRT